ncbi:hypothetical protein FA15DRAFT_681771 [Coprinopsis marcescibilis]|uniref:CHAT domain-containing protein n=1 Tax=Coprinopsis marcescibilis TaxID=230819 RepID=A0A5C3L1X9_COPMA|nr:hypothetical protein FA15DRAFT_681771 [Coprinopsis marcescibilis]
MHLPAQRSAGSEPSPHPNRSSSLNNLANALSTRFSKEGNIDDLDQCVSLYRESLDLMPAPHPSRSSCLNNLAVALCTRFEEMGNSEDLEECLEECISLHSEALDLRVAPHPEGSGTLNNMASAFLTRFECQGDFADLDQCIAFYEESLSLRPALHPSRSESLTNLATALSTRFEEKGNSLLTRYEQKGDFEDSNQGVALYRKSLDLTPGLHPERSAALNNLASSLSTRFGHRRNFEDLKECISLYSESLTLRPAPHPNRRSSLNNLANALFVRFEQKGTFEDLDQCISFYRESLNLTSENHADRSMSLGNLSNALITLFERKGDVQTLDLMPAPHPNRSLVLSNPGSALHVEFTHSGNDESLRSVLDLEEQAAKYETGSLLNPLRFSAIWASRCLKHRPDASVSAYAHAIRLLPLLSSLDMTLAQRQNVLLHARDLASQAVHCTIASRDLESAIVHIWSQALQLRSPLDRLESLNTSVAQELRIISRRLEISSYTSMAGSHIPSSESAYSLSQRREQILKEIREMDGLADFLLPPSFASLRTAALNGPIVFLNATESSCNALIMHPGGSLTHVPLPKVKYDALDQMQIAVQQLAQGHSVNPTSLETIEESLRHGDALRKPTRMDPMSGRTVNDDFKSILEAMWVAIVEPVVIALQLTKTTVPPRVWWCVYSTNGEGQSLLDYAVSSYCYTPQDLISDSANLKPDFTFLAVMEPEGNGSGARPLPKTLEELDRIREHIPSAQNLLQRVGSRSIPISNETILNDIRRSSIVHFGCHGDQHPTNPLESCLLLSDGPLTMSTIIRECQTSNASLAYLSACQTAKGDEGQPDEGLTLAATMMFAGFRGVVGTMWSIYDVDAPIVADVFYRYLFRHGIEIAPNTRDAAYGLHLAVQELRRLGRPFANWVPFVHYGT